MSIHTNRRARLWFGAAVPLLAVLTAIAQGAPAQPKISGTAYDAQTERFQAQMRTEGKRIFRFDTFGSEAFWGGKLKLHQAIQGSKFGGVGNGVSPNAALALGLKVDSAAIPASVATAIRQKRLNLDDPAVTLELLKLNAVVGVTGFFDAPKRRLTAIGIQCALCHSTVDDSFAPGIGRRLDGWANRDLNVGAIIASAPDLSPYTTLLGVNEAAVKRTLLAWGPGKFDAQLILDGKGFRPDGKTAATLLPPAYGMAGVNNHTWTGSWGSVPYWNAFVANLEMQGQGVFFDPRLDNAEQYPIAAKARLGHKRDARDLITAKLPALHTYQAGLPAPTPPAGSFNQAAATRGSTLFKFKARCATCHVPPTTSEPGWNLRTPQEIGIDAFQADRAPDRRYRTAQLKGLWAHQKGGFYHDGRFPTLRAVVDHYDAHLKLGLTNAEKNDLIQYLLSI